MSLAITFCAGYFAGIRHADARLPRIIQHKELNLPRSIPEPDRSKAVKPAVLAPGANIDVDAPDKSPESVKNSKPSHPDKSMSASSPQAHKTAADKKMPVKKRAVADEKSSEQPKHASDIRTVVANSSIDQKTGGEAASPESVSVVAPLTKNKSGVELHPLFSQKTPAEAKATDDQIPMTTSAAAAVTTTTTSAAADVSSSTQKQALIIDDASRQNARYSIQIGIYGSLNNATSQVDRLNSQHLNAYYETYKNQANEDRYRVRFGYFASHSSAQSALDTWKKTHPNSFAYVVQFQR